MLFPVLLECLQTEEEHPFARPALGIIQQWLSYPLFSLEVKVQDTLQALCVYWSSHPTDLRILAAVFGTLDSLHLEGSMVYQCFYLAASIFDACFQFNDGQASRVQAQKWFCAGILSVLAVQSRSLLTEFVLNYLSRILTLEAPRGAIIDHLIRKATADLCSNRIMYALLKASKTIPEDLRQLTNDLHAARVRQSTWISQVKWGINLRLNLDVLFSLL